MKQNILIVGAGITGLSTGIYAHRNGFNVSIFESHSITGRLCTTCIEC